MIFSRVRAAPPPLMSWRLRIGFIGAVDVGIDLADLVQVEHRDAGGLESLGGSVGARHRAGDARCVAPRAHR